MIKQYIEQAIKSIEAEKERTTAPLKATIIREKIAPFNAQVDNDRARAIAELDKTLNAEILAIKERYATKKQEIVEIGEKQKRVNEEAVFNSELAVYTAKYDKEIVKLKAQLAEIEE